MFALRAFAFRARAFAANALAGAAAVIAPATEGRLRTGGAGLPRRRRNATAPATTFYLAAQLRPGVPTAEALVPAVRFNIAARIVAPPPRASAEAIAAEFSSAVRWITSRATGQVTCDRALLDADLMAVASL